jgi:hypothetical protein
VEETEKREKRMATNTKLKQRLDISADRMTALEQKASS